jgi:hypothetical protein
MESEPAPLKAGSKVDQVHQRVAAHLVKRVPIFQVSSVLNCELWAPGLAALLRNEEGLTRPLLIWNSLPMSVKKRAARLLRANYRPISIFAGRCSAVAERSLDFFYRQHEVEMFEAADVLVFGLPDVGPASVRSSQNPLLAANLALGYVANLYSDRPLLRRGGVLIFANPLIPEFDQNFHRPHQEFYEKVLRTEREPVAIHERFEAHFVGRPEYVSGYQSTVAFHGAHPLYAWYLCTAARRHAGWIIAAHGDPRACARLGFGPARDVEEALAKAREFLGKSNPAITVLEIPPPFWSKLRAG